MNDLRAEPAICPACGELIVVRGETDTDLTAPVHPDRVEPWLECAASDRAMREIRSSL